MTTVLRINGNTKAVREFLASTHWRPVATYFRGQPVRPSSTRKSKVSGFNLVVSKAGRLSLRAQVRSVERFIQKERRELRRLNKLGLHGVMDFAVASPPEAVFSFFGFPSSLLVMLAPMSLGLEVSYYGVEQR